MFKITATGSGDIYLGPAPEFNNSSTYIQVESTPNQPWSGSLIVASAVNGAPTKLSTSYGRISDGALLSGSISSYVAAVSGPLVPFSGSFLVDSGGQDLFLRHVWNSGSVDIYYTIVRD
jgi:hypothetical protein